MACRCADKNGNEITDRFTRERVLQMVMDTVKEGQLQGTASDLVAFTEVLSNYVINGNNSTKRES